MNIKIVPVQSFPNKATSVLISDGHVSLGEGAHFQFVLLDDGNNPVSPVARIKLSDGQYQSWGNSDEDLAKQIVMSLGLTPL